MQGSPPGTGKQDKHTHFVDLWGFKPDMALGNTKQGIFFLCVCVRVSIPWLDKHAPIEAGP